VINDAAAFAGSVPGLYDRHLGPLLFEPYAEEVARRAAQWRPKRILETAAGTGIVTAALAQACPQAEIVATDLNQAMLDIAARRARSVHVRTEVADAQDLPFDGGTFDLVVCQFGIMFFPDKVKGNAEARRVLRDGGRYLLLVWDRLDRNPASQIVHDSVGRLFPNDPPRFLERTPFGYADLAQIERDLLDAGFTDIEIETVARESSPRAQAEDAAAGLVRGCPLKAEIEERDPTLLHEAEARSVEALLAAGFPRQLSAHVVTAIK